VTTYLDPKSAHHLTMYVSYHSMHISLVTMQWLAFSVVLDLHVPQATMEGC